jgi:hypothetical protein
MKQRHTKTLPIHRKPVLPKADEWQAREADLADSSCQEGVGGTSVPTAGKAGWAFGKQRDERNRLPLLLGPVRFAARWEGRR